MSNPVAWYDHLPPEERDAAIQRVMDAGPFQLPDPGEPLGDEIDALRTRLAAAETEAKRFRDALSQIQRYAALRGHIVYCSVIADHAREALGQGPGA